MIPPSLLSPIHTIPKTKQTANFRALPGCLGTLCCSRRTPTYDTHIYIHRHGLRTRFFMVARMQLGRGQDQIRFHHFSSRLEYLAYAGNPGGKSPVPFPIHLYAWTAVHPRSSRSRRSVLCKSYVLLPDEVCCRRPVSKLRNTVSCLCIMLGLGLNWGAPGKKEWETGRGFLGIRTGRWGGMWCGGKVRTGGRYGNI